MSTATYSRESVRDRPSGVWDYVSPSRLNLWLKCPLAFKFRYIDGVETPSSTAQFVGKLVHAGLEHYYRHRQIGITLETEAICSRLADLWDQIDAAEVPVFPNVAAETSARAQAIALVRTYLLQAPTDERRPLAVEAGLSTPLVDPMTDEDLGIPLVGVIDLVLPEREGPLIVDFKTVSKGGEALAILHEVQLTAYGYLFRHVSRQVESGFEIRRIVKTKTPRLETDHFAAREARHFNRFFAVVRAYLDDLDRQQFLFRPGFGCASCEHRLGRCSAWSA